MILRYKHDRKHGAILQAGFQIQIPKAFLIYVELELNQIKFRAKAG